MKRLLVLNFFPAFTPPASGGELRYFNMYARLCKRFDVTLLSPTYSHHAREVITHGATFREHRIPKEPLHDQLHLAMARDAIAEECSALVCALASRVPNRYHDAYLDLQADADAIVHESPYMLDHDVLLGLEDRPRIYNSYNVESDLVAQMWRGPSARRYIEYVTELESRLAAASELMLAVSDEEAERFAEKFGVDRGRIAIAPNGVTVGELAARRLAHPGRPAALFFGSFHPPNIEAARYVLAELAPECPALDFVIAGSCLAEAPRDCPPNVTVRGRVDDAERLALFAQADLAINPMWSGGGTNLKALEFLAAGLPMVTTALGARGLGLVHGTHALVAEGDGFVPALLRLAKDPALRARLSRDGREHVVRQFGWDAIADAVGDRVEAAMARPRARRRTVLVLNDFSAAAPTSGGAVRINRIYRHLAPDYRIASVCLTDADTLGRAEIVPGYVELQIPKTAAHRVEQAEMDRRWPISVADIVSHRQAPRNAPLCRLVRALHEACDAVVLVHPYMVGVLDDCHGRPVVYESLNVETDLKRALLKGHPDFEPLLREVEACERQAISRASAVVAVAEGDRDGLIALGAAPERTHCVPHGVDVAPAAPDRAALHAVRSLFGGRPFLVFLGSAHPPNIEAARDISGRLAPALPECVFGVAGDVGFALPAALPANVLRLGRLDEVSKDVLLELADVALNPMTSGSGSNLKLADYFARALPTVTTAFGARGYDVTPDVHAVVCSLEEFPRAIRALVRDEARRRSIGASAHALARSHLDWGLQARRLKDVLETHVFDRPKRRLLVVTYRFTDPPLGGGEVHLLELLRRIERQGDFSIDIATLDIVTIENQFHFSSRYTRNPGVAGPEDLAGLTVHRFPVDQAEDRVRLANARVLFARWMEEDRALSLRLLDRLPSPLLLGGWHLPERAGDRAERWSSPRALLHLAGVSRLTVPGWAPGRRRVAVRAGSETLLERDVRGDFELRVSPAGHEVIELVVDRAFEAAGDPRPLGVRIREIVCETEAGVRSPDLEEDYRGWMKRHDASGWIDALIAVARARPPEIDDLFQRTRGPVSAAMEAWLAANTARYDVVIGHSVPFGTTVAAAHHARRAGVPLVQIPEFHIDDEYYHWQSYYEALAAAQWLITFPRAATPLFFDRIGARSEYVPHGIDPDEAPTPEDEAAFRRLYPDRMPFVLVVGRKDPSKRYDAVIRAVGRLNEGRRRCALVMIGRDEDGVALDRGLVTYLGGQPRGIVLAALRGALCLVSMSESESFGIVILEAWAQGCPVVVSSACQASVELVRDGQDGLHATPATLAERIAWLLDHRDAAARMGRQGRERARASFGWRGIAERVNTRLLALAKAHAHV